jgi:hypothetical protein
MPKRSDKRDADTSPKGGGIVGAVTQDIELTIEQAEEAAKKAAHKAAVALGIASGEAPAVTPSPEELPGTAEQEPAGPSTRKPTP